MDKNIAAILREDTKTIGVTFSENGFASKTYTYVANFPVDVGDTVVVPSGSDDNFKLATVSRVDVDLEIEPSSSIRYKWAVSKVDFDSYTKNMERNKEIERQLATAYRSSARQAYAQQFLIGASPEVIALVKGS
jgi:hypothetical protein